MTIIQWSTRSRFVLSPLAIEKKFAHLAVSRQDDDIAGWRREGDIVNHRQNSAIIERRTDCDIVGQRQNSDIIERRADCDIVGRRQNSGIIVRRQNSDIVELQGGSCCALNQDGRLGSRVLGFDLWSSFR